jgi:RND family efflux transporter MFP subunit
MKKTVLFLSMLALATACSKPAGDKKAELAELKKQKTELDTKIAALEKELGGNKEDSTKIKIVVAEPVQPQTFKHFVEVQGSLDSDNNISVSPKTGGVITQVAVKVGDYVSAGQVLALIDDATYVQNLAQLETSYSLAKTVYEKQANLWNQKIGSEIQYLQAKNNKEGLEKQIATLKTQWAMTRITSPIAGSVDAVNVKIGDMATPGTAVAKVVNLSMMKVKAKVADSYINSVKKGDPVTIKLPDINEEKTARITFAGQVVNSTTRTFDIEIALPNGDNKLKPNLLTVVNINDKTIDKTLVIDENLIQKTELGDIVFVASTEGSKTTAKLKKVKKGLSYNGKAQILEGLEEGELIITTGNQDLVDGQTIKLSQPVASK